MLLIVPRYLPNSLVRFTTSSFAAPLFLPFLALPPLFRLGAPLSPRLGFDLRVNFEIFRIVYRPGAPLSGSRPNFVFFIGPHSISRWKSHRLLRFLRFSGGARGRLRRSPSSSPMASRGIGNDPISPPKTHTHLFSAGVPWGFLLDVPNLRPDPIVGLLLRVAGSCSEAVFTPYCISP